MSLLDTWDRDKFTADGRTYPVWRKGTGPGVVIIHEIPGITPEVIRFSEDVVAAGFTVVMPQLFSYTEIPGTGRNAMKVFAGLCVRKEFTKLATRETTPLADWLRALARDLHAELGGPGVGALGMCFTGGFALAMMVDEAVAAPVLCQPSTPLPIGRKRKADLNLSDADLVKVKERAASGCEVLGLRFLGDPAVGNRFDRLTSEIGEKFIKVEFPGKGHSTVTEQRQEDGVERVLAFFHAKLDPEAR